MPSNGPPRRCFEGRRAAADTPEMPLASTSSPFLSSFSSPRRIHCRAAPHNRRQPRWQARKGVGAPDPVESATVSHVAAGVGPVASQGGGRAR